MNRLRSYDAGDAAALVLEIRAAFRRAFSLMQHRTASMHGRCAELRPAGCTWHAHVVVTDRLASCRTALIGPNTTAGLWRPRGIAAGDG